MNKIIISMVTVFSLFAASLPAQAEGSIKHSAQALNYSLKASGHAIAAGVKLSAAVVAVPLMAVGAVGAVSQQAGEGIYQGANSDFETPLPISEKSVTSGPPPSEALYEQSL